MRSCRACGEIHYYPRSFCPSCWSDDVEWVEATGAGTVHAVTVVRRKDPADNYNVVLVDLAEGPRLMSRVDGITCDEVKIGMAVRASIVSQGDAPLLVFLPA